MGADAGHPRAVSLAQRSVVVVRRTHDRRWRPGQTPAAKTIGTYGVLSYMVTERRREIGIRVALGATRQAVLRMILRQGLGLTVSGIVIGLVIALVSGRAITSLLFGVTAADPTTIAGVVALIVGAALVACYVPGHAASRVDPMVALREE